MEKSATWGKDEEAAGKIMLGEMSRPTLLSAYTAVGRKLYVCGGGEGGHEKEIFSSGIIFLGYKSN